MNSFSILKSRQVGLFAAAGALLLALILPSIVSAAQLTERSIELSSASVTATGVTYKVNFTATQTAGAVLVDFCKNSPLIGEECIAPVGFNFTAGGSVAKLANAAPNTAVVTQSITAGATSVTISGITNPTEVGTIYARIITYDNATNALLYDAEEGADADANRKDEGGAAISITNKIGVSGAVLESLTFCVAGNDNIGPNCVPIDAGPGLTAPTLKLGEQVGDVFALVPGEVSEGSIYTQLSTNAASGAVVSLKSSTLSCGGLMRFGADPLTQCDIKPATSGDVTGSAAQFGVKTATATGTSGTLVPSAGYSNSVFALNFTADNSAGVTSTFGNPFLNTNNLPASNQKMTLTFAASATNQTPAGLYSADLSLIATGKF